ncbi:TB2/DP1, HVA22 family-domain-containing protein [Cokeromyces recurvatus]|uniref:TB2/DP1, HVA22 family-domain-containing protein n=1 Tax=Cokeromyces recurvatus TaxID=90255 RepID=UPI00221F1C8B|nr:TB2/DP1, HVA22 family-domain-containing protein [Cokeromyces recurvatus]KAI7907202.1 TB2/DP1, HVA22 family-domain-containing protein [Cokeromyces recurvatus]
MSLKHDETSTLIEKYINSLNKKAPINISFITQPLTIAITSRIRSLEQIYGKLSIYRYLMKKGVYPFLLFTTLTGSIGYGLQRTYTRSTKLVLNLLGVLYPTYCCWRLVKNQIGDQQIESLKAWLTYWMIFGFFQVLDHWTTSDLFMFSKKKYNLYKLLILYWAQSPHSKGAFLLYQHVIQKPLEKENSGQELMTAYSIKGEEKERFRYLDGYMPPDLLSNHLGSSVSSSSSNNNSEYSIESQQQQQYHYYEEEEEEQPSMLRNSIEKEVYSSLLMSTTEEASW